MLTSQLLCAILKEIYKYKTVKEDGTISPLIKKQDRFESFVILIDSVHKCISKVKHEMSGLSSIKSVHTLWLYELLKHKEGLTSTELAEKSNIDRSLVSREIRTLVKGGYIVTEPCEGKRGYNARITLTEKGESAACEIADMALRIQKEVSDDIDVEALTVFYETLERISCNLERYNKNKETGN